MWTSKATSGAPWCALTRTSPVPASVFLPNGNERPPPITSVRRLTRGSPGVERQGDTILVHSLHGSERNRYFANRGGRSFEDISGLSGLDNPADSRGFAVLDYDRDGWQDVAVVNANQPLFNLYHNEMPAAGLKGGMIAIRFVGGNRTPAPSKQYACRDGFGARVDGGSWRWKDRSRTSLRGGLVHAEFRHDDRGHWLSRHGCLRLSAMAVRQDDLDARPFPEGTLLTVYENPADSPSGEAFTRSAYRTRK